MSTNPSNIALLGHRWGVYLRNHSGLNEIWCDRVQNVEPSLNAPTTKFYELGNLSPVGVISEPVEFRVTLEENLHSSEIDSIVANGSGSPVASFTAGDMINSTAMRLCVVGRDVAGTDPSLEYVLDTLTIGEVRYRFVINGACSVTYSFQGRLGNAYTTGSLVHSSWGALNTVSPGAINGKDAYVYFGSGLTVPGTSQAYRLMDFDIRCAFPVQVVKELGSRQIVGMLADVPDVTCDFNLNVADKQPTDVWFTLSGTGYDLSQPVTTNAFIEVYDPALTAKTAPPVKSFRIENVRPTTWALRSQTRALATYRYSLTSTSATTLNSAGLCIFSGSSPS